MSEGPPHSCFLAPSCRLSGLKISIPDAYAQHQRFAHVHISSDVSKLSQGAALLLLLLLLISDSGHHCYSNPSQRSSYTPPSRPCCLHPQCSSFNTIFSQPRFGGHRGRGAGAVAAHRLTCGSRCCYTSPSYPSFSVFSAMHYCVDAFPTAQLLFFPPGTTVLYDGGTIAPPNQDMVLLMYTLRLSARIIGGRQTKPADRSRCVISMQQLRNSLR